MSRYKQEHEEELNGERRTVGSLSFMVMGPAEAALFVSKLAKSVHGLGRGFHIHLANAYTVSLAENDAYFQSVLSGDAINFADGKPISVVSNALGHDPALQQVRGPDLFENVMGEGLVYGVKHFLLGSTPAVLEALEAALIVRYGGLSIVGKESPPFRALSQAEYAEQDRRVLESGAEIVWVGLGTPKQDFEAKRLAERMPVVAVAIGAAFDFSAGTLVAAPQWVRKMGLEWLHRLIKEPRRLWKRYLFGNVNFIVSVVRNAVGGKS
ncbi:WecB/TagA/CpsF family glycosyltransferase [Arthrobacter sp. KNU-44]|uniref:WecB/TagA/CpsF family glycosyltransferase n=1 Tax=unclassified Arthrobacter TaxID=235627 RepID=UPI003F4246A6